MPLQCPREQPHKACGWWHQRAEWTDQKRRWLELRQRRQLAIESESGRVNDTEGGKRVFKTERKVGFDAHTFVRSSLADCKSCNISLSRCASSSAAALRSFSALFKAASAALASSARFSSAAIAWATCRGPVMHTLKAACHSWHS
jgi:hypothetical protein